MNLDLVQNIYERNELLWGKEAQEELFQKHIIIMGLGGVGSYAAEALARSGVGKLTLVDFDTVSATNINRQLIALLPAVGKAKTDLMKQRIKEINPHIETKIISDFYTSKLNTELFTEKVDFVVDAIDSIRYKIELLESCYRENIPVISSMGAGNRLIPEKLYISDISEIKPKNCSFVKNILYLLRKREILNGITVVASTEKPRSVEKRLSFSNCITTNGENIEEKKFTPGSSPFVPPVAGYMMASYIVRKLIGHKF